MPKLLLLVALLLGVGHAQTIPNMEPATSAQRLAINGNARAFTGRSCVAYGVKFTPVPKNITPTQARAAMDYAVNYLLATYKALGVTVTKMARTPDGGAHVYLAMDPSYMQVAAVTSGSQRYTGTFGCVLK